MIDKQYICSKHGVLNGEADSLHHKDRGCSVKPYFGESETDFTENVVVSCPDW